VEAVAARLGYDRGMSKRWRVLQVGLGPLGIRIASDLLRRQLGDVVAAVDPDPALIGRAVAELVPRALQPLRIVGTLDEVDVPIDLAIVTTVSDLPRCAPTLRALAARGMAVVSTCEELSWPWERHPVIARDLDDVAKKHGARILGTGVNPGFVMDALAVAATTACAEVRRIEIHRVQDAATRRIPFQKKIGAGMTVADFQRAAAAGTVRHVGLRESVGMVAATLGLPFDRVDEMIEPVIASHALECSLGPIAAGDVRGVHQEARAHHGAREVIALVFRAAIAEPDARDQIIVDGEPAVNLIIPGGLHGDIATSAVVLNSARSLLDARPGLHTMTTLPLAGCAPPIP
jgi:2,4-diaminopentanoate dehydrogenase